jgi:hypothetical protein
MGITAIKEAEEDEESYYSDEEGGEQLQISRRPLIEEQKFQLIEKTLEDFNSTNEL